MPVCDALRGIVVLVIASLVYCSVKDTTRFIAKTAHNCLLSVSIAAYFFAMYASRALFVITVMRIVSLQRNADNAIDLSATAAFMTLATLVNFPCAKNAKDSTTSHSLSFRYGVLAVEASVATLGFAPAAENLVCTQAWRFLPFIRAFALPVSMPPSSRLQNAHEPRSLIILSTTYSDTVALVFCGAKNKMTVGSPRSYIPTCVQYSLASGCPSILSDVARRERRESRKAIFKKANDAR